MCPCNELGQPMCQITTHPDNPQNKLCMTCGKKFVEQGVTNRSESLELPFVFFTGHFLNITGAWGETTCNQAAFAHFQHDYPDVYRVLS